MSITCLLLATGYAWRIPPTRRPATQAPKPETNPAKSGCLAQIQAQQDFMIQSDLPKWFLVVSNKGSRTIFGRTFDNLNREIKVRFRLLQQEMVTTTLTECPPSLLPVKE